MVNNESPRDTPLLTPPETSEYLKVPYRTLSQWRHRHQGPPWVKVGRHVRYRREDVDAWLVTQEHGGTEQSEVAS